MCLSSCFSGNHVRHALILGAVVPCFHAVTPDVVAIAVCIVPGLIIDLIDE